MKIILTGGGTAGHINPALAIAEELKKHEPTSEILFIGRKGGAENLAIKKAGFKLEEIEVKGIERRLTAKNIKNLMLALHSKKDAEKIIKDFSCDLIIGTGGYVCWPVLKAGRHLGIKTALHESNAVPGLATKMLSPFCNKVFLNYSSAEKQLIKKSNISIVGNPLRKDFGVISRQKARKILGIPDEDVFIVSFGGSGGASLLNEAVIRLMKNLSMQNPRLRHVHATGRRFYKEIGEEELKRGKSGCKIVEYIDDMPVLLSAADIAVTRGGALTLSEIAYVGVCSVIVPSPNVTGNHQYKNARVLERSGACVLVREGEEFYERLYMAVKRLSENRSERAIISRHISAFSRPDAAEKIYYELRDLL